MSLSSRKVVRGALSTIASKTSESGTRATARVGLKYQDIADAVIDEAAAEAETALSEFIKAMADNTVTPAEAARILGYMRRTREILKKA